MTERGRQRAIQLKSARSEAKRDRSHSHWFFRAGSSSRRRMPRGLTTELSGAPASGKTTYALRMVTHTQQNSLRAAWIDAEHVFDPAYAAQLGVGLERLAVARADTAEESLETARQLCRFGRSRSFDPRFGGGVDSRH